MATDLLIETYIEDTDNGVITGEGYRVYALLFDRDSNALALSGAMYGMYEFSSASQNNFAIELTEHAQRTKYWYNSIPCSGIVLPDNDYGERYTLEFWCSYEGGNFSRTSDFLLKTKELTWLDSRVAESRLDQSQEASIASLCGAAVPTQQKSTTDSVGGSWGEYWDDQLGLIDGLADSAALAAATGVPIFGSDGDQTLTEALSEIRTQLDTLAKTRYEAFVAMGYNSDVQRVTFTAWLEKDGELITDPESCTFLWQDREGNVIATTTREDPETTGVFFWDQNMIDLEPDISTFVAVSIKDGDGVEHTSASAPVTWD